MKDVFTLVTISLLAFATPLLADRFRIPAVVLEVFAGMVLGTYGLGIIVSGEWLEFLSMFGLIFLMFLSGLDLDINIIRKKKKFAYLGLLFLAMSLSLSYLLSLVFGLDLLYAILLTNVSVGIVVPTVREMGLIKSGIGQQILVAAFITDFVTMFALTIYAVSVRTGRMGYELLFVFGIFLVFLLAYYIGRLAIWHFPEFMSRWFMEDPMELGVRGSMAIMVSFVGLSYLLGVEAILGAFLAGALLSIIFRGGERLEQKLYSIGYGFLIPIFFISIGASMDPLQILSSNFNLLATLMLIAFAVKLIPSLIFVPSFGLMNSLRIGIIQTSKLSLTIAGVSIGENLGVLSYDEASTVIFFTILTCLISPTIFRALYGGNRK